MARQDILHERWGLEIALQHAILNPVQCCFVFKELDIFSICKMNDNRSMWALNIKIRRQILRQVPCKKLLRYKCAVSLDRLLELDRTHSLRTTPILASTSTWSPSFSTCVAMLVPIT